MSKDGCSSPGVGFKHLKKRRQRRKGLPSKLPDTSTSRGGISKGGKAEALCEIGGKTVVLCHESPRKSRFEERGSGQRCCWGRCNQRTGQLVNLTQTQRHGGDPTFLVRQGRRRWADGCLSNRDGGYVAGCFVRVFIFCLCFLPICVTIEIIS